MKKTCQWCGRNLTVSNNVPGEKCAYCGHRLTWVEFVIIRIRYAPMYLWFAWRRMKEV